MESADNNSVVPTVTPQEDKWCTMCKHVGTNGSGNADTFRCFAPQNKHIINLVNGSKEYEVPFCATHRKMGTAMTAHCGTEGRWWEFKPMKAPVYDAPTAPAGKGQLNDDFTLPALPMTREALATKIAAAKAGKGQKPADNLLKDLGL